jgi:hypothetical protein
MRVVDSITLYSFADILQPDLPKEEDDSEKNLDVASKI